MRRVLFWSELFWPYVGGAETFAVDLLRGLRERGHELLVVTSHAERKLPDEDELFGIPVRRLPMREAIAARDVRSLGRVLRDVAALKRAFGPELVHVHSVGPSLMLHLRSRPGEAPWLLGLQNEALDSQRNGGSMLLGAALQAASWIVGCSRFVTEQARRLAPEIGERCSTIYNGVVHKPLARAETPEQPTVVYVGRLVPVKGVDVLLEAIALLAQKLPEIRLVVVGDGPARPSLELHAQELRLAGVVDFRGLVEPAAVPQFLGAAGIVAMPSRREGLPLVAVQAASAARPVVASRVGGVPEIVVDGETGWLVEPDEPVQLADALEEALRDPQTAERRGQAARDRALALFGLDRAVEGFDRLYRQLGEAR